MEKPQRIDARALKKGISRRAVLKDIALAVGLGSLVGTSAHVGLGYLGQRFEDILVDADKQVKELAIDIRALSGYLERKMAQETRELKESYTSGKLSMYEELGIATPQELSELESIIKTSEAFEAEYGFVERLKIFKDRVTRKLSSVDSASESVQPGFMKRVNDSSRKLFGMKTGEEGAREQEARRKRLDALCGVYDTNEDNRVAETEVLKRINNYLENGEIPKEEKELYEFLRGEYQKEGSKEHLRDFIRNYETYGKRKELLTNLRDSLNAAEEVYQKIQENRKYVSDLQGILKKGIELKTRIREQSPKEFGAYEEQIQAKVGELRAGVDGIIQELESKGYEIDTREEAIERGTSLSPYLRRFSDVWNPVRIVGGVVAGGAAALGAFYARNRGRESRAYKRALNVAVESNNQAVDAYDSLAEQQQDLKE